MAGLIDQAIWETEIYQLERTDAVVGGVPNVVTKAGTSNIPHLQLAQRAQWLRAQVEALQNGAGYRGAAIFGANQTLTAADMGRCLVFNGTAAATLTLPAFSAVTDGSAVEIINTGTANLTITRAGSDQIDSGPVAVTTIVIPPNQSLKLLRAAGSAFWHVISVSAAAGQNNAARLNAAIVTFNGVTGAILLSSGISSVAILATGNYRINFAAPMPTANYAVSVAHDASISTGSNNRVAGLTSIRDTVKCDVTLERADGNHGDVGRQSSSFVSATFLWLQ